MLFQLPNESRILRKLQPANNWNWNELLLNKATYLLEILVWQKTKDGQKRNPSNRPQLYTPDFMINVAETKAINKDSAVHTTDDIKAILAKPRK